MNEIEDGMGFSGLVPTRQERRADQNREEIRLLRVVAAAASDVRMGFIVEEFATINGGTDKLISDLTTAVQELEAWRDEARDCRDYSV